uniref:NHERF family PDZ scaffold protein 2 n=1 Tax=Salmo trutta TaxID=8032 RepID=A0A673WUG0_SALTR
MGNLRPRLCFLTKGPRGYGFHLHGERNKGGQFIRKVEPGSSAELSGLRAGDRLVEVNGENVEDETHHQVSAFSVNSISIQWVLLSWETYVYIAKASEMDKQKPLADPSIPFPGPEGRREGRSGLTSLDTEFPMATVELLPRLCHMVKGELGYGFNLHSDRTRRGQFIRSVDPGSPAQHADLRPRDRLVNGVNIEALRHSEVVSFIRGGGDEACLLVVDAETDELFKRLGVTPTSTHDSSLHLEGFCQVAHVVCSCVPEVYVDEPMTDSAPPTPSSTTDLPPMDPPIINVPEDYERRVSDPFLDSGLHLSPTAAEAKERAQHGKKRAPPMDWSKKQEIFSNF